MGTRHQGSNTEANALNAHIKPRHAAQIAGALGRLAAADHEPLGAWCRKLGWADGTNTLYAGGVCALCHTGRRFFLCP